MNDIFLWKLGNVGLLNPPSGSPRYSEEFLMIPMLIILYVFYFENINYITSTNSEIQIQGQRYFRLGEKMMLHYV